MSVDNVQNTIGIGNFHAVSITPAHALPRCKAEAHLGGGTPSPAHPLDNKTPLSRDLLLPRGRIDYLWLAECRQDLKPLELERRL
jgi:hypothetical protein